MPSPHQRSDDHMELPKDFPMPNSLFPQYSKSHPGFDEPKATVEDDEETVDFLASDGTPVSSMLSANSNHKKGARSPEGDKQIPLHVQTDDTMSENEDVAQNPSDFPCLSPQAKKYVVIPFQKAKAKGAEGGSSDKWTKCRLWTLLVLILVLLISIVALIARTTGGSGGSGTNSLSNSNAGDNSGEINLNTPMVTIFGNDGGNNMLPPMTPTTPRPTTKPTSAPTILVPTVAPFSEMPTSITNPPTVMPTTRAPTLNRNHPLVGVLEDVTPLEDLINPYTPQGEALIWLATRDKQTPSADPRIIQRYAMVVLDVALHTPEPRFWSSRNSHECQWPGVMCNEERHVTEINWARQQLPGTIPPELGLLTHLSKLDIAQNQLKGNLEPLYDLHKLKFAYLFENYLTGTISEDLENCRNLTRFFVGHNQLTGSIPSEFKIRPLGM